MASVAGEPEWCKGYNRRNTHLLAIAPNMSTALICGGVSQGIEPVVANVFNQNTAAGEIQRINPSLLKVMKERGVYNKKTINEIVDAKGSILGVDWLTDEEKLVFRTAFEVDQMALLRLASARQKYVDQGQSLNLFFAAEEDPKYISQIHRAAAEDPRIKALYYMRSQAGVQASKDDCVACEG
jgi:ribonucleoside-diphosphate reductase alpha chain